MKEVVEKLMGKVIVSCQAYEDTPLYGAENMKTMARSVLMGGAEAIRACWPQDIKAIRSLGDFPIIGLNKVLDPNREDFDYVYITPTFESAKSVIEAGCDVLALDCTLRYRSREELYDLLKEIREAYPDIAIMADCETLEEAMKIADASVEAGADILEVGTPLLLGEGVHAIRAIRKKYPDKPIVADVKIMDAGYAEAKMCAEAGADYVCVMGVAHSATVAGCVQAGKETGIQVMVDYYQKKVACLETDNLILYHQHLLYNLH